MKDEIKEIIDNLIRFRNEDNKFQPEDILTIEDVWLLLDCITNLKQIEQDHQKLNGELREENKKLQEEIETLKELNVCVGCNSNPNYKLRNEKAIEYIMTELITEWDIKNGGCVSGSDLPVDAIIPLLNILNGDDKDVGTNTKAS